MEVIIGELGPKFFRKSGGIVSDVIDLAPPRSIPLPRLAIGALDMVRKMDSILKDCASKGANACIKGNILYIRQSLEERKIHDELTRTDVIHSQEYAAVNFYRVRE